MALKLKTGPKLIIVLVVAAAFYVGWWHLVPQIVYRPIKEVGLTPAKLGIPFEEVVLRTPDGLDLQGWYIRSAPSAATTNRPTVLFFHDAGCTISGTLDRVRLFHDLQLNALVFDYRGFGNSQGWPAGKGVGLDALAAYFHLVETRHVSPKQLLLYGEGLGAGVAIELATKVRAAGLIAEAAATSLADRVELAQPRVPWALLLGNQFDAIHQIKKVNMPVLLIHSVDDREIPFRHSERLFIAAGDPKELLKIRGEHQTALRDSAEICRQAIGKFVRDHVSSADDTALLKLAGTSASSP